MEESIENRGRTASEHAAVEKQNVSNSPPAQPTKRKRSNWPLRIGFLIGIVALIAFFSQRFVNKPAVGKIENAGGREEVVPVSVAKVSQKDVPVQVQAIGNVEAYSTVAVRALVSGELMDVHFKQGQDVRKGDPLFTIDPRPLQDALEQARANLAKDMDLKKQDERIVAKDEAQLRNAQVEARRYTELVESGLVSHEQADQFRTNAETFAATVQADLAAVKTVEDTIKADQAAIKNAVVQLSYTSIRSPMDGRTGSLLVYKGNLIKANDTTPMVTINQVTPIYVTFSVPEKELPRIKDFRGKGNLKVVATIPDNEQHPEYGELTFIENAVDVTTGTIRLKATFPNAEKRLWPGQFVNVQLTLTTEQNALVVPSQAVQTGQSGAYVYVVQQNLTAESRAVTPGIEHEGFTTIEKGLNLEERVVTDGQLRLVPGAKVSIKPGPAEGEKRPSNLAENEKQP